MKKLNILKNATLRNAKVCENNSNTAHNTTFDLERDFKGWDVPEGASVVGVSAGFLFFSALTNSPAIGRSTPFALVDSSKYTEVVIRIKYIKNGKYSVASKGKVQFITASDLLFDDVKSLEFDLVSDIKWHTYYLNFAVHPKWIGYITKLKIFPTIDGAKDDEIFISSIRIQKPIYTYCSSNCYDLESITVDNHFFDLEPLLQEPEGFSIFNVSTDKKAYITYDPSTITNKCLALENKIGSSIGPGIAYKLINPALNGSISMRFRLTSLEGSIKLTKDLFSEVLVFDLSIKSNGKMQYLDGLILKEVQTDHKININTWYDLGIIFNSDTMTITLVLNDLVLENNISYKFSGPIDGYIIRNLGNQVNIFYLDNILVVQDSLNTECPGIGKQGEIVGQPVLSNKLIIIKDINDTLIVNINGYGDVIITLPPAKGDNMYEIRDSLERQISSIDMGGYPYAEVDYSSITKAFSIKSGTFSFNSNVVVKQYKDSRLSQLLGFTNSSGESIYTSVAGRPHSSGFKSLNGFRLTSKDLLNLKSENQSLTTCMIDAKLPRCEIGSRNAGGVGRKVSIEGLNKTIIDLTHRATEEGIIDNIQFQGILSAGSIKYAGPSGRALGNSTFNTGLTLGEFIFIDRRVYEGDLLTIDTVGYEGNGTYLIKPIGSSRDTVELLGGLKLPYGENLSFSISRYCKVKQFRQNLDGTITLINEAYIGLEVPGNLYTRTKDSHEIKVNWEVHRGDLIGIYHADKVHTGNDSDKEIDALYLEIEGDAIGNITLDKVKVKGQGIKGIGLYGFSNYNQQKAIIDITLEDSTAIEYITLDGLQKEEDIPYNLLTATNRGLSLNVISTGTHVHITEDFNAIQHYRVHQNIGYNEHTLVDGKKQYSDGNLGALQTNNSEATYFYISGDAEFGAPIGVPYDANTEYPNPHNESLLSTMWYNWDIFSFNFILESPKYINRYVTYFKEYPNVFGYWLEYLKDIHVEYDGSSTGFELIGEGNSIEYNKIYIDTTLLLPETAGSGVLRHHFKTKFEAYPELTENSVAAARRMHATGEGTGGAILSTSSMEHGVEALYIRDYPYTVLDKYFTPVKTTALNWVCNYHESTKITELELYSTVKANESFSDVIELYISTDGYTYQRSTPETITPELVKYNIATTTKSIRISLDPNFLQIKGIYAKGSDNGIRYLDGRDTTLDIINTKSIKGGVSDPTLIKIKNKTCKTAYCEISVDVEELIDSNIILKTSLNTLEDILKPEIGPPGIIIQDPDFDLPTVENVAVNSDCYGLQNLAVGKKFYISDIFKTESDNFIKGVDPEKWTLSYSNIPQSNLRIVYPGFTIKSISSPWYPSGLTLDMYSKLKSVWIITGGFNASIIASYNANSAYADPIGSSLGVVDLSGREIRIRKRRYYRNPTGGYGNDVNYALYDVYDSSITGTIAVTDKTFSQATYGTDFGIQDDGYNYNLNVTRVKDTNIDKLIFSYIDTINGTGNPQWEDSDSFELDLNTLTVPLQFPLKLVMVNTWYPTGIRIGTTGPPYVTISRVSFGGSSNYSKYYDFSSDIDSIVSTSGYIGVNNKSDSPSGGRYLAIDLNYRYWLDIMQIYSFTNKNLWNSLQIQYSNSETDNPIEVEWGNSSQIDARWLLFSTSIIPTSTTGIGSLLEYVRVYPDITKITPQRLTNSEWDYLGKVLTDNNSSTYIRQVDYPVILVKLDNNFDMYNFKLYDNVQQEYLSGGLHPKPFYGWTTDCQFTTSSSLEEDPKRVTWENWYEYIEDNKAPHPMKWIAFKDLTFNTTSGLGTIHKASEIIVTTDGLDYSSVKGQSCNRVDCTEYANWFNIKYEYKKDVALIVEDDFLFTNELYGIMPITTLDDESILNSYYAFDGKSSTYTKLQKNSASIWRVFANIEDQTTYYTEEVQSIRIDILNTSLGIPNNITVQKFIGIDPTEDMSWSTIYTETDLACILNGTSECHSFNNDSPYIINFETSLVTSGIRVCFSDVQYYTEPGSIYVSAYNIYKNIIESGTNYPITIYNDPVVRYEGIQSLAIKYKTGFSIPAKVTAGGNFNLEPDPLWSIQDYLSFYLKIDKIEYLDLTRSYIRLGKDANTYYEWSLSQLNGTLDNTLKQYLLKFKDAIDKGEGDLNYNSWDLLDLESQVNFKLGPITFLELEVCPKQETIEEFNIWVDNFNIKRENNTLQGINKTLYLNNSELLYFPIVGLNLNKGSLEFTFTPDWGSHPKQQPEELPGSFTLFNMFNGEDETFTCSYSGDLGLKIIISTEFETVTVNAGILKEEHLQPGLPIKFCMVWDSEGSGSGDLLPGCTLRCYINDSLLGDSNLTWNITSGKDTYFYLGSTISQAAVGTVDIKYGAARNPNKHNIQTITAGIENLIILKEPIKLSYSELNTLRDKLYISLDGITYYSGSDSNLPLKIDNVPDGAEIPLYVKINLPLDTKNMSRTGFLRTKWRLVSD